MRKILVLDDDETVLKALQHALYGHFVVFACRSSTEAFERFDSDTIDGMVVDLDLGADMTGLEFAEFVRSENTTVPICLISKYLDSGDFRAAARDLNASYLNKPFEVADLVRVLGGE